MLRPDPGRDAMRLSSSIGPLPLTVETARSPNRSSTRSAREARASLPVKAACPSGSESRPLHRSDHRIKILSLFSLILSPLIPLLESTPSSRPSPPIIALEPSSVIPRKSNLVVEEVVDFSGEAALSTRSENAPQAL
jgi:hypothetical protein